MPHSSQPDLGPAINVELEPDIGDATEPSMTANFDVRYVNAVESGPSYRYLVTLINIKTGAEEMADILIGSDSFLDLAKEVRKHYGYNWQIFEWFSPHEPF